VLGARPVADGTLRAPALGFSEHCSKNKALTCLEARQDRGSMLLGTLPYSGGTPALVCDVYRLPFCVICSNFN
jgi:hypothetical protein